MFHRFVFLKEDYVKKPVNVLSGLGGTMGLWLGLSLLSIGEYGIVLFKKLGNTKVIN